MTKLALLLICSTLILSVAACSKAPTEELSASQIAIDAVVSEGGGKFTPEDLKLVQDALTAAQDEIKLQDGKFLKNYDQAKKQLADVKAQAEALKTKVSAVKEEQRMNAVAALASATDAISEALALLEVAPQGKGSLADIAMMKADVAGLQEALGEVQPLIDSEDYIAAGERAVSIQGKAAAISEEVTIAQEKFAQTQAQKK